MPIYAHIGRSDSILKGLDVTRTTDVPSETSRQAQVVANFLRRRLRPLISQGELDETRYRRAARMERLAELAPVPRGVRVRRVRFDGFHGEWVTAPKAVSDGRAVLYFHGGAFFSCGVATHRRMVSRISAAAGIPVLSIAYRQLPDVKLDGSVADCVTAYRQLLAHGYDPEHVVIAGDSAGGFLAFAATLRAIEEGLPRPAGIVGLSPWLDLDCTEKLTHENAATDPYIVAEQMMKLATALVDVPDPLHSPVGGDLRRLPPALIQAGSIEVLRHDAELMAGRMEQAGVPCRLQIWNGQVHVFQAVPFIPESRAAIREVGRFVREMTDTKPRTAG